MPVFVYIPSTWQWMFGIRYAPDSIRPYSVVGMPGPIVDRTPPRFANVFAFSAVIVPSRFAPTLRYVMWSRPCVVAA
jgi:hypothetical protein